MNLKVSLLKTVHYQPVPCLGKTVDLAGHGGGVDVGELAPEGMRAVEAALPLLFNAVGKLARVVLAHQNIPVL